MDEPEGMDSAAEDGRWTCDACGCNTNSSADTVSCHICGSRRIPAFLRRASRNAASRLFANHYGIPRGALNDDQIFEDEGMEIHFDDGMMGIDADDQAVAALALQVAGVTGAARIPGARSTLSRRQRFPNSASAGEDDSNHSDQPAPEPPETLLQIATENASSYQPKWASTSQIGGRSRSVHDVGPDGLENVARIPDGVAEGLAIRASQPLPRATQRSLDSDGDSDHQRMIYGFRVLFDHPHREAGMSLGDCYLVGVTTSSFLSYGDRNALMQSSYFWGIEDNGNKFEGVRRTRVMRPGAPHPSSGYGIEMSSSQAPRNSDNVLFGAQETVTVVVDLEKRSMAFWRDENFLGTLVRGLPRSGYLFPVVVPFNAGATVAITGMDGNPLPSLKAFIAVCERKEAENANRRRRELAELSSTLVQDGKLSPHLKSVLRKIFFSYTSVDDTGTLPGTLLDMVTASRLWYASGLMLSDLRALVEAKVASKPGSALYDKMISADDFLECVDHVVQQDIASTDSDESVLASCELQVGDKVELVDSYTKFGDATCGPLQPGDRGMVIELKKGSSDEIFSVRVSYKERLWWYHPRALVSQRSGLVESPSIWFLHKVLRSHGYDQRTLEPLWGKPIGSSWEVGDIVVPRLNGHTRSMADIDVVAPECFGRIIAERPTLPVPSRGHKSGTVLVEFADSAFGRATGVMTRSSDNSAKPCLQVRRVPVVKLLHGNCPVNSFGAGKSCVDTINQSMSDARLNNLDSSCDAQCLSDGQDIEANVSNAAAVLINTKVRAEIEGVACLDLMAIQSTVRACENQSSLSNGAFASSLCDAILSGVSLAEQSVANGKLHERVHMALSSLGLLSGVICKRLLASDGELAVAVDDAKLQETEDQEMELSGVAAEAMRRDSSGSAVLSEEDLTSDMIRSDALDFRASRRMNPGRHRGHLFRTRARHANSAGPRSPRDELNSDEDTFDGTRWAIYNGLLTNSLSWLQANLDSSQIQAKARTGSESFLSSVSNSRDEQGMSLLMLAIKLGCSKSIVHHLILSEADVGTIELKEAAVSNQPHLLSLLLEHSACPRGLAESLHVSSEVSEVFRAADARQRIQDENLRRKVNAFASTLIIKLCRLGLACRKSQAAPIQRLGRSVSEALVGNVLLRASYENQQKALAATSPRSRKHGGFGHPKLDVESERMSLAERGGAGESVVFAPAAAMSPMHGVLLVLPEAFFCDGFLGGSSLVRRQNLTGMLSIAESLLWSKDKEDIAAGLSILYALLKNVPCAEISLEVVRYGLNELILAHELMAGRYVSEIKSRRAQTRTLGNGAGQATDASRATKKRPRPHLAATMPNGGEGVVLCPKFHVAELHLTKHSSFRCDLCGRSVLRGCPMHGCRECDWDACDDCTNQAEGGIVKWGYIMDLALSCRKLLDGEAGGAASADSWNDDGIKSHPDIDGVPRGCTYPDFGKLARRLRERDETALSELAAIMESSGGMTNHEFVIFILPALHASLTDVFNASTEKDQFCRKALEAFTSSIKSSESTEALGEDDSHMSIEEVPSQEEDESVVDSYGQDRIAPPGIVNDVSSDFLRRLQGILAFSENIRVLHGLEKMKDIDSGSPNENSLQALTCPIEIEMSPSYPSETADSSKGRACLTVLVEPLLPKEELQLHVLRAGRIMDPPYLSFCRRLARFKVVIVERPMHSHSRQEEASSWQIAQVLGFDEDTGSHHVRYPSKPPPEMLQHEKSVSFVDIDFDGHETMLILAARDYVILHGSDKADLKSVSSAKAEKAEAVSSPDADKGTGDFLFSSESVPTGTRVETNCVSSGHTWLPCTVISHSADDTGVRYDVVSDNGEVFREIRPDQIRGYRPNADSSLADQGVSRGFRDSFESQSARDVNRRGNALSFPFFRVGHDAPEQRIGHQNDAESRSTPQPGVLKRSWSALSPLNGMCPLDIPVTKEAQMKRKEKASAVKIQGMVWSCSINGEKVLVFARESVVEAAPKLRVDFSACGMLPPVDTSICNGETVVHTLHWLLQRDDKACNGGIVLRRKQKLRYHIRCDFLSERPVIGDGDCHVLQDTIPRHAEMTSAGRASISHLNDPLQKGAGHRSPDSVESDRDGMMIAEDFADVEVLGISEGLDVTCLQCMEVMNVLAGYAEENVDVGRGDVSGGNGDPSQRLDIVRTVLSSFESDSLSQKLKDQLEDPLIAAGGALPEWSWIAPSIAPRVFSYSSRRQLLLRTAFGVSRSTLEQQEAKVAVGPLRQRMTVLRGRAVELMGEAFSGDVEDPTVLQLQADELYGMEEALGARVTAAFRAQRWQERSLQCAKAVVRREVLLSDAAAVMERYAKDERLKHRRLEVRFQGESGFDAAPGDQSGVTRGFYSDVAEALLSGDHVSAIYCPVSCISDVRSLGLDDLGTGELSSVQCRLPLWIPDMDASHQVIIPTPRASPHSSIGVYPRPLSSDDPFLKLVCHQFRFIGRLFAAAMRDGLMFPLQLSPAFLKLVQSLSDPSHVTTAARSCPEGTLIGNNVASIGRGTNEHACSSYSHWLPGARTTALTSADLPRPGFLGGEVYAVEAHICTALDRIDQAKPPLSAFEAETRRQEIASDRQFARCALGKTYDCSFEEFFQDRVFVDPLSPTQGEDAAPLCPNGHLRQVNIANVREWVALSKRFLLHDGVIEQALAFRQGVGDFFPAAYLRIFTATELQRDVCGGGDKVDRWTEEDIRRMFKFDGGRGVTEALVAVAAMGGEGGATLNRRFGPSSPTIGFLVRTLLESSPTQRRQFLSFVTSVPIATPGKIEVVPMVSPAGEFLPMRDPGCLPRANTCARRLYLPRFEDYESFSQVLRAVIREESKFKGFYEWRG